MLGRFFDWLQSTSFATAIAEGSNLFPAIETIHVLAISLVVGSIAMIDLRLLNVCLRQHDVVELSSDVLPWTWVAFAVAAISGAAMFASSAHKYSSNPAMQIKMVLIALAGVNMLVFHFVVSRSIETWRRCQPIPPAATLSGGCSLMLWIGVVFAGRWVGFL